MRLSKQIVGLCVSLLTMACTDPTNQSLDTASGAQENLRQIAELSSERSSLSSADQAQFATTLVELAKRYCRSWPADRSSLPNQLKSAGFEPLADLSGGFEKTISGISYGIVISDYGCSADVLLRYQDTLLFDPVVFLHEVTVRLAATHSNSTVDRGTYDDGSKYTYVDSYYVDEKHRTIGIDYPTTDFENSYLALSYLTESQVPLAVTPNSVAGHFWRCEIENATTANGMTLRADSMGNWDRVRWDGRRSASSSWVEWNFKSTFYQDGNVVTETIYEADGQPAYKVNVYDVSVQGNRMQITFRSKAGKPGTTWNCEDRPAVRKLLAGSYYCNSYNSALSGRQIDLSGNPYVQMPRDCSRLDGDIKPEWSKEDRGITKFGFDGRTFFTWSALVES